jgi:FG-GAP-like repeat
LSYNRVEMRGFRWGWLLSLATVSHAQFAYLTYPTGINPSGLTAADLNGDGRPDLVIANLGSNSLTILLNDGMGRFTPSPPLSLGTLAPQSVLAADLNGDRKIDLVVISAAAIPSSQAPGFAGPVVLLGNGDGTFQSPLPVAGCAQVTDAQLADLNGDCIPDLAVTCLTGGFLIPIGAYLAILPGNGDGTFGTGSTYELGFTPWAVLTIGDFNQDGKPDVAAVEGGGLTVLLNDGKANFTPVTSNEEPWNFAPGIAAGDFNGDGLLDLAVSGQSLSNPAAGTVTILLGRGDGTFQASAGLEATGFGALVAMDLNGDEHVDLVEGLSTLTFFAGQGDGTFENGRSFRGSGNSGALALGDFTGTGVMGFASTNQFETTDGIQIAGNAVILPWAVWPLPALANVSAAGFGLGPLAPGSIACAFGLNLGANSAQAMGTLPISLGGETVSVTDSAGTARPAQLYNVSPEQVNYVIPADTAPGLATVSNREGNSERADRHHIARACDIRCKLRQPGCRKCGAR